MAEISKLRAQKNISLSWFVLSSIIIVLFIVVSSSRVLPNSAEHINWLINYLSPGLSIIVSSFIYSATNREKLNSILNSIFLDRYFHRLVLYSSIFYLLFILGIICYTPWHEKENISFIAHLKSFSAILNFEQTILLALLGIFFIKQDPARKRKQSQSRSSSQ
jgi:hypothetical protein